ncbi:MAG: hypothetical protein ACRDF4_05495, partial [Rhabdochlamydiaceae bacterium]
MKVLLAERKDHFIFLRDVETRGYFPGNLEIVSRPEGDVKAPFTIGESREVITDMRWYLIESNHLKPFLLIVRTSYIFTALQKARRVVEDTPDVPAYSQILQLQFT